jgi:hypothetical protein
MTKYHPPNYFPYPFETQDFKFIPYPYDGLRVVDDWSEEKGMVRWKSPIPTIYVHPEDALKIFTDRGYDHEKALNQLKKVIHHKIDHGYYGRGKRA